MSCEVKLFPMTRRAWHIRACADAHDAMPREDFSAFWDRVLDELELSMLDAGIEPSEIKAQLQAFGEKVRADIVRRTYCVRHREPDEAA